MEGGEYYVFVSYTHLNNGQDMNRYASPIVKVAFDGPDVKEEALYWILRVRWSAYYAMCQYS